jgi:predicted ribosomally synthesized peptide with SipW-like signal peptide
MGRKRIKQYLMLLLAIGVIAVVASGSGTFASFNAQVTNPNNTFAAGTLFLHNTHGATTCKSETGSLNTIPGTGAGGTDVCATLFNVDLTSSGASTATLALNNAGTINAQNVKFDVSNCTVGTNQSSTGSTVTFGTAPTCGDFWITIQETQSDFSTNVFCAYGPGTLATACASPDNTKTLANSTSLTNLQTTTGSAQLAPSATRYYVITIQPTVASDNQLQNRKVTFDMDWQINS